MVAVSRIKGVGKSGGRLARRKAALERAAERVAEQRRAAAEAEAERLRREAAFDELVADFELAVEDEQAVVAAVEEEVRRVRERGRVRVAEARAVAARIVLAMGDAGESVAGCGRRLGVTVERVRELRRLGREAAAGEETAGPGAAAAAGEDAAAGVGRAAAGEDTGPGAEKSAAREAGASAAGEKTGAGGGPRRDGGHSGGSVGGVRVPAPPPGAGAASGAGAAGGAGSSGSVGGARSGWPESR